MNLRISAAYYAGTSGIIELPDGTRFEDIKNWYVKWDTFHYVLKNSNEWKEIEIGSDALDVVDWKRPTGVTIESADENGLPIEILAEE